MSRPGAGAATAATARPPAAGPGPGAAASGPQQGSGGGRRRDWDSARDRDSESGLPVDSGADASSTNGASWGAGYARDRDGQDFDPPEGKLTIVSNLVMYCHNDIV